MANTTSTKTKPTNNQKIAELEAMIAQMSETIARLSNNTEVSAPVVSSPKKKIKVTSLTYGNLSLYAPNRGFIQFSKYGETLTLSYDQICDYVNNCRSAAESGMFFINDANLVDELDLSEFYKNIITSDIVKGILNNHITIDEYDDLLSNITPSQKESLGELFTEEVYTKKFTDLNKIDALSHTLGIDIMKKVEEVKTMESNLSNT